MAEQIGMFLMLRPAVTPSEMDHPSPPSGDYRDDFLYGCPAPSAVLNLSGAFLYFPGENACLSPG